MVGENGDFLDELFDQSLIKLCDVGFLTGDEVVQFVDTLDLFVTLLVLVYSFERGCQVLLYNKTRLV